MTDKPLNMQQKHSRRLLKGAVEKAGRVAGVGVQKVNLDSLDDDTVKALTLVLRSLCDKAQQAV